MFIIREGKSDLEQLTISGKTLVRSFLIIIVLIPTLLYLGAQLLLETAYSHRISKIRNNNRELHVKIEHFSEQIKVLEREMMRLTQIDEDLRAHADIPALASDIRDVGIGGSISDLTDGSQYLLPVSEISIVEMGNSLDALTRKLNLEQLSYENLRESIKSDLIQLDYTPSIRPNLNGGRTSGYGFRRHPYTLKYEFHKGLDISIDRGSPVVSTADGKVVATRHDRNLGLYIKIDHGNGFQTLYGHLREFAVNQGEFVKRGTLIGYSGNSGRSTAPHLHYEVRHSGKPQNPINYF